MSDERPVGWHLAIRMMMVVVVARKVEVSREKLVLLCLHPHGHEIPLEGEPSELSDRSDERLVAFGDAAMAVIMMAGVVWVADVNTHTTEERKKEEEGEGGKAGFIRPTRRD